MKPLRTGTCMAILFLSNFIYGHSTNAEGEPLAEQFVREAPQKWREHASLLFGLEAQLDIVTERVQASDPDFGRSSGRMRILMGHEGDQGVYEWHPIGTARSAERVAGCNHEYSFELTKPQSAGDYSLYDLRPGSVKSGTQDERSAARRSRFIGERIRRLRNVDLLEVVPSPDFTVLAAKEFDRDGHGFVQIDFRYHPKSPDRREVMAGIYKQWDYRL